MKALQTITNTELFISHAISHRGWTKSRGWTAGWTEKIDSQKPFNIEEPHALSGNSVQPSNLSNYFQDFPQKKVPEVFNRKGWTGWPKCLRLDRISKGNTE